MHNLKNRIKILRLRNWVKNVKITRFLNFNLEFINLQPHVLSILVSNMILYIQYI